MKKFLAKANLGIFAFSLILISLFIWAYGLSVSDIALGQTAGTQDLSGYAWSSNIGWISFKGGNYGVKKNADGTLSGYAWSSNIGWISFNSTVGTPHGGGPAGAKISGGNVTGWARACSVFSNTGACSGDLRPLEQTGGWEGWISLSGGSYGVTVDSSHLQGYAWGSEVVGWVNFCVDASTGACVSLDELPVACRAYDANLDGIYALNESVTWVPALTSNQQGTSPYDVCWGDGCAPTPLGGDVHQVAASAPDLNASNVHPTATYSSVGPVTAKVKVKDKNYLEGNASCSINVTNNSTEKTLTVSVINRFDPDLSYEVKAVPGGTCSSDPDSSPCDYIYTDGTRVELDADDPGTETFTWYNCDAASGTAFNDCTVTMNENKTVTAVYGTGIDGLVTFSDPTPATISRHNEGSVALSTDGSFKVANGFGKPIRIEIRDIRSTRSGNLPASWSDPTKSPLCSLSQNADVQPAGDYCVFGVGSERPTVFIPDTPPGEATTVYFRIGMKEKSYEAFSDSPFILDLGVAGLPNEAGTGSVRFNYAVPDVRPK